MIKEKEGI